MSSLSSEAATGSLKVKNNIAFNDVLKHIQSLVEHTHGNCNVFLSGSLLNTACTQQLP